MNPSLELNGLKIVADIYVCDSRTIIRTWRERLLTRPWRPFTKTKSMYSPRVYLVNDIALVSPQTFDKISREGKLTEGQIIGEMFLVQAARKALTGEK